MDLLGFHRNVQNGKFKTAKVICPKQQKFEKHEFGCAVGNDKNNVYCFFAKSDMTDRILRHADDIAIKQHCTIMNNVEFTTKPYGYSSLCIVKISSGKRTFPAAI